MCAMGRLPAAGFAVSQFILNRVLSKLIPTFLDDAWMWAGPGAGYQGRTMATASKLMAEVTREYELCMSSLVFDSNMMNEANIQVRRCRLVGSICRLVNDGLV